MARCIMIEVGILAKWFNNRLLHALPSYCIRFIWGNKTVDARNFLELQDLPFYQQFQGRFTLYQMRSAKIGDQYRLLDSSSS
jgi:hypothetical protein